MNKPVVLLRIPHTHAHSCLASPHKQAWNNTQGLERFVATCIGMFISEKVEHLANDDCSRINPGPTFLASSAQPLDPVADYPSPCIGIIVQPQVHS